MNDEMPTPCADCGKDYDLNDMYSMSDGTVICDSCKAFAEITSINWEAHR